jgi:hypothetical protein
MPVMYVDGRPKFYDPDIDWHAIHQEERVSRLAAVPFFEEAGSLLQSAAHLWPGRVRGKEIAAFGAELLGRGTDWRRTALSWTDAALKVRHRNLPREEVPEAAGPLLHRYWDARRHMTPYGQPVPKHEAAARRLVGGALALLEIGLPIAGKTGDHLYRRETMEACEDRLEIFLEGPYAQDAPKPSEEAFRALKFRAVCRVADGLCYTAALVYANSGSETDESESDGKRWWDRSGAFSTRWKAEYARFAAEARDEEERSALMAARDESSPYAPTMTDRHYDGIAKCRRAGRIVECLVTALCRAAVEGFSPEPPQEEEGRLEFSPDRLLPSAT